MMIGPEAVIEAGRRAVPSVREPEEQVIQTSHEVRAPAVFAAQASRPQLCVPITILVIATQHGIEVPAEHDARYAGRGESRRLEQVEDGADLAAARVLEHP